MDRLMARLRSVTAKRGGLTMVAREANIPKATLWRIAKGETVNPGYQTVQAIEQALDRLGDLSPAAAEEVSQ